MRSVLTNAATLAAPFSLLLLAEPMTGLGFGLFREIDSVVRDPTTRWMVLGCLAAYFATFSGLQIKARATGAWWLVAALACCVTAHPFGSASPDVITLLLGTVLGQGLAVWHGVQRRRGQRTGCALALPGLSALLLSVLLAVGSLYGTQAGNFSYRHEHRWAGLWQNPNLFGLLMSVGVVLATGTAASFLRRTWGVQGPSPLTTNRPITPSPGSGDAETQIARDSISRSRHTRLLLSCSLLSLLCAAAALPMLRALFHTYSRGAWLGMLCGVAYLVRLGCQGRGALPDAASLEPCKSDAPGLNAEPIPPKRGISGRCEAPRGTSWKVCLIAAAVGLAALAVPSLQQTDWRPVRRVLSVANPNDFSLQNRVAAWEGALQIITEKPWLGAGWDQAQRLYEQFYVRQSVSEGAAIEMNDYLKLGVSIGIPGLLCFLVYTGLGLFPKLYRSGGPHASRVPFSASSRKTTSPEVTHPLLRAAESEATGEDAGHNTRDVCGPLADWSKAVCRAGALVLAVGFWFDGGLFKLATGGIFWILLELGREEVPPGAPASLPASWAARGRAGKDAGAPGEGQ